MWIFVKTCWTGPALSDTESGTYLEGTRHLRQSVKPLPLYVMPLLRDRVARVQEFRFVSDALQHSTDGNAAGLKAASAVVFLTLDITGADKRGKRVLLMIKVRSLSVLPPFPTFWANIWFLIGSILIPPTALRFTGSDKSPKVKWNFHFNDLRTCLLCSALQMTHSVRVKQSIDSPGCFFILNKETEKTYVRKRMWANFYLHKCQLTCTFYMSRDKVTLWLTLLMQNPFEFFLHHHYFITRAAQFLHLSISICFFSCIPSQDETEWLHVWPSQHLSYAQVHVFVYVSLWSWGMPLHSWLPTRHAPSIFNVKCKNGKSSIFFSICCSLLLLVHPGNK